MDDAQPNELNKSPADQIYSAPAYALVEAEKVLFNQSSSNAEQAAALATLGRSAYYDNRMGDAVNYLRRALPLTDDESLQVDIALILAPALSKEGHGQQGLDTLDFGRRQLSVDQQGKAHNQRGIILTELGQLPLAVEAFAAARNAHREGGDLAGEGRALVNMAAAASEIGNQDQALDWYEEAWKIISDTGQGMTGAIIEGNLGYVASRRGDFSAALAWYSRARQSFSAFGEVELLVAVLEVDHATTLLDLGLNGDAFEAADFARSSSQSGSNRMLEVQALLLLGESQLRLRHYETAEQTLISARDSARELEVEPWRLRCEHLLHRLSVEDGRGVSWEPAEVLNLANGLTEAAWHREALQTAVVGARAALDSGEDSDAKSILRWAVQMDPTRVDLIDLEYANALNAFLHDDTGALRDSLERGFAEMSRQQQLVGNAELQVKLGHRANDLTALALRSPLSANDAAGVLRAREASRWTHASAIRTSPKTRTLKSQLRDARVGLQEAQLGGKATEAQLTRISTLERRLLASQQSSQRVDAVGFEAASLCPTQDNTVVASFLQIDGHLYAVRAEDSLDLVQLGPIEPIESAVRTQRSALRQMAASKVDSGSVERATAANTKLDQLLVAPLELSDDKPLVMIPDAILAGLSWAGLSSLITRPLSISPNAVSLVDGLGQIDIASIGLLGGGDLIHAEAELSDLEVLWGGRNQHQASPSLVPKATVTQASEILGTCDFVHVAAHGTFRSDNPLFSSLQFADGPLSLLDLGELERLPQIVVLASCDSGAARIVGAELVGTTEALLSLGVKAVVAPGLVVDDAASRLLMLDLHRGLLSGLPLHEALRDARMLALGRDTPADTAAALAFQVHGGSASTSQLNISCI